MLPTAVTAQADGNRLSGTTRERLVFGIFKRVALRNEVVSDHHALLSGAVPVDCAHVPWISLDEEVNLLLIRPVLIQREVERRCGREWN